MSSDSRKRAIAFVEGMEEFGGRLGPEHRTATIAQQSVIFEEEEQIAIGVRYSKDHVDMATVHARQDIILVATYTGLIAKRSREMLFWMRVQAVLLLTLGGVLVWHYVLR